MVKNRRQLHIVTSYFVLFMMGCLIHADMKIKVSCLGDEFKLECPFMSVLLVHLTSPSIPPSNSSLCADVSKFPVPCDLLSYSDWLKKECSGRRACTTGKVSPSELRRTCRMSYIVTVVYECKPLMVNSTTKTFRVTTRVMTRTKVISRTKTRSHGVVNETQGEREISSATCLFYTLFSATMALQYMQGRPKHLILCFVLSISAGIVILMIAVLLMACIEKIVEENKRKESTAIEISLPLLVTPSNIPATSTQIESAQTSEAGSGQREVTTLPRIHSIRRSHSVDEGTQTEAEANEMINVSDGLSDNEAKELGYLVDIMRYYNSNLEHMPPSNEPYSLKVQTPAESESVSSDIARARTEMSYRGPRIVDTSRRRQPCLSSTTYSSSNNSENGDAALFLPTPSVKQNHVGTRTPTISTLPRRRPYSNAKHDSFTHTPNSIHMANSPRLLNGPRTRDTARARFADDNPVFGKHYGTLS